MVGEYYCAALGTFYGTTKGTKYKVTLDTGKTFKIILCDTKSNRHTDKKHQYAKKNKDVVEFYVDRTKIPAGVNGNYNRLEPFHWQNSVHRAVDEWGSCRNHKGSNKSTRLGAFFVVKMMFELQNSLASDMF